MSVVECDEEVYKDVDINECTDCASAFDEG